MTLIPIPQRRRTDVREGLTVQVRHLPVDYQIILALRFIDGLTLPEIARVNNVSIDEVRRVYIAALDLIGPHINRAQGSIYGNRSRADQTGT